MVMELLAIIGLFIGEFPKIVDQVSPGKGFPLYIRGFRYFLRDSLFKLGQTLDNVVL
jgi:hypothetical protein